MADAPRAAEAGHGPRAARARRGSVHAARRAFTRAHGAPSAARGQERLRERKGERGRGGQVQVLRCCDNKLENGKCYNRGDALVIFVK
jgi:hypothetical protein